MATGTDKIVNIDKLLTFGGNVQHGDDLAKILRVVELLMTKVYENTDLTALDLSRFGIECKPEDAKGLLAQLFDVILRNQMQISSGNSQISKYLQSVENLVGKTEPFKVRSSATSSESRYLNDSFNDLFGHIKLVADKITLVGLVPLGAQMYIAKNRVKDFDNTGRGKPDTDLNGWFIRNGQNGTDNALNKYVKTVGTDYNLVGTKAGTNKFTVSLDNIVSFTKKITGSIAQSLSDGAQFPFRLMKASRKFGTSGTAEVLVPGEGGNVEYKTDGHSFRHGHGHDLKFEHVNNKPKEIELDLEHIKELPIVFLGF